MDFSSFDTAALRGYLRGQLEKKRTLEEEHELTCRRISEATAELVSRKDDRKAGQYRELAVR